MRPLLPTMLAYLVLAGCSALPDVAHEPQYHNPFPQLSRVAVLPFYNQSAEPTVDSDQVALAYYNELQAIPGFEVVPVGVTKQVLLASGIEPRSPEEFQRLARLMGVDAVVAGSVTEFSPYYPPRMGLSVRWYAANPGFHPIPPGYGLPWGTPDEEFIPKDLVFEAEFALAKEQLKTQTPEVDASDAEVGASDAGASQGGDPPQAPPPESRVTPAAAAARPPPLEDKGTTAQQSSISPSQRGGASASGTGGESPELPPDWPDPRGFVPPLPSPTRPPSLPQSEPIMTHTRLYHGHDAEFTRRLAGYYYFRDDARFDGWQGYLQRSEDFVRFCCHIHIAEMLSARGGAGETRVVWRWPIRRYER